jgi:hypothetical protein
MKTFTIPITWVQDFRISDSSWPHNYFYIITQISIYKGDGRTVFLFMVYFDSRLYNIQWYDDYKE